MTTVTQMDRSAEKSKQFLKMHVYFYRPNSHKVWPMSGQIFSQKVFFLQKSDTI
jgi:hypothetical protein